MNNRLQRLKQQIMTRKGSFVAKLNPMLRDVALWRASQTECSRVQRRAGYLLELIRLAPVEIPADWTLAGEHLPTVNLPFGTPGITDAIPFLQELGLSQDQADAVKATFKDWAAVDSYCNVGEADEDSKRGFSQSFTAESNRPMVYWARGWVENHSIRDFAKVLRLGFIGIRHETLQMLESLALSDPERPGKENFLKAALLVCEAGIELGERYADKAQEMAASATDAGEKQRLLRMSEVCRRVPAYGARNLFEAVQSLWLTHILTCGEDGINANSIGRLDQILQPFYQKDLQSGKITAAGALDLMIELACKLYLEYDVQAITLGGVDRNGNAAVHDMSQIILKATEEAGFIRDISVRIDSRTPDNFLTHAAQLIAKGGGIPFMFNDDCFIKALHQRGIAITDARDYAPIGCVELTIPGRANPHAVSGWINALKCLELALFSGKDPETGMQAGPDTGALSDMTSYEQFLNAYKHQLEFFSERMAYHCNCGELRQREKGPLPCWSTLTDDCISRGRDITDGGAIYNYHSICFMGTANTADSLMALKKLVFENRILDPDELLQALRSDFANGENIRRQLLAVPKYGNDAAEVDEIARDIDEHFIQLMDRMRSPLGGRYFVHLFSFRCNLDFGQATGATPDGRQAGEPLAYSLSAQQGRDVRGVTALLHSLARLPHDQAAGGSAAIIDLTPELVAGEQGIQRLVSIIKTIVALKVGQVQFNVVTAERLQQAQRDPEQYGNIPVRVAGYSQMFKLIPPELQNHIIARTKHRN